jgi:hypothetical protein
LFNGDARSYIDNAIGAAGGDTITGNVIANTLNGRGGNDTSSLVGRAGNATIVGGTGTDVVIFSGARTNYLITTIPRRKRLQLRISAPDRLMIQTLSPALIISSFLTEHLQPRPF